MFKVPFYGLQNYQRILGNHYDEQNIEERVDLKNFVELLTPEFVAKYSEVDARGLGNYLEYNNLSETVKFAGKFRSLEDVLVATKLLIPTLWTCDYFLWNQGLGGHTGIDIVLPKGTPVLSISGGKVVRIKKRNGQKKDEGNCVVVKSGDYYFSYHHLDAILLEYGQDLVVSSVVGTCGNTGNAGQYHVHIQIDTSSASFYPYWSAQHSSVQKNTENPLMFLRKIFDNFDMFYDMPDNLLYRNAIRKLVERGIITGNDGKIFPYDRVPRRQAILWIDLLAQKYRLYSQLPIHTHHYIPYADEPVALGGGVIDALKRLQKYGIMLGKQAKIFPHDELKGEEWLALLGRLFFRLQDTEDGDWFVQYLMYFQKHKIIGDDWSFVGYYLDRKEAFYILDRVLSFVKY